MVIEGVEYISVQEWATKNSISDTWVTKAAKNKTLPCKFVKIPFKGGGKYLIENIKIELKRPSKFKVGDKIGELVVLEVIPSSTGGYSYICRCSCGKIKKYTQYCLAKYISCGHLRATPELIGKTLKGWTVVRKAESKNGVQWECKNQLGQIKLFTTSYLLEKRNYKERYKREKEKIAKTGKIRRDKEKHIGAWRGLLRNFLVTMKRSKTNKTHELLGYSPIDLKNHLESLWLPGMNWENYGVRGWHIDHIRQVIDFPIDTPANVVNSLSNLRPMWATTREIDGIWYEGNLNREKAIRNTKILSEIISKNE